MLLNDNAELGGERLPTVVIVDDLSNSRFILSEIVRRIGYDLIVKTFATPSPALEFATNHRVDLFLTDHYLPEYTGVELIRRFRALAHCDEVPVVMVTAEPDVKLRYEALSAGANDFLLKPFDPEETKARCRNLLHMRRQQLLLANRALLLQDQVNRAVAEVHDRELETLAALARAAEQRDKGTGHHLQRMARFSGLIARGMGLNDETVRLFEITAPLHDIGKLGVLDSILLKPGRLTDEEMAMMRTHSRIGYDILKGCASKYLKVGTLVALHHHERYDGAGYPDGLVGKEIPLAARVVAVADVFDALLSPRPYKAAWTIERTLDYMRAESGKQFDPDCVTGFFTALDQIVAAKKELTSKDDS